MSFSATEFKEKLQDLLRADSTLRDLLGKSADPYGIYFARPPAKSPPFPLVTFKIIGGDFGGAVDQGQVDNFVFQIAAYSKNNCVAVMRRVEDILYRNDNFSGMDSFAVLRIEFEGILAEEFDPEFDVNALAHRYRAYMVKLSR